MIRISFLVEDFVVCVILCSDLMFSAACFLLDAEEFLTFIVCLNHSGGRFELKGLGEGNCNAETLV